MSKLLIRYKDNWADEMDLRGLAVITYQNWEVIKTIAQKFFSKKIGGWTYYVGTNEDIKFESYEDWLCRFKVVVLDAAIVDPFIAALKSTGMRDVDANFEIQEGFFPFPIEDDIDDLFTVRLFGDDEEVIVPLSFFKDGNAPENYAYVINNDLGFVSTDQHGKMCWNFKNASAHEKFLEYLKNK